MSSKLNKYYPIGWWKCTKSKFKGFDEGNFYECRWDVTGSPRIYTNDPTCSWAPYWQDSGGKFCYPRSELNFEYVVLEEPRVGVRSVEITYPDLGNTPDEIIFNGVKFIRGVPKDES